MASTQTHPSGCFSIKTKLLYVLFVLVSPVNNILRVGLEIFGFVFCATVRKTTTTTAAAAEPFHKHTQIRSQLIDSSMSQ